MDLTVDEIIAKLDKLATLPEICLEINRLVDDPDSTTKDIEDVINKDPTLSARILSIANSPFYGSSAKIDTISRAITVVGTNGIRDLVWATSAIDSFQQFESKRFELDNFWRHSLYCATVARVLASKIKVLHKERFFVASLLHDVGRLVLFTVLPNEMDRVFEHAESHHESLTDAEQSLFGFTHAQVGAALLKSWGLPKSIQDVARYHHRPAHKGDFALEISIAHIADQISRTAGVFGNPFDLEQKIDAQAWVISGLTEKIIDSVIAITDEQYQEASVLFLTNRTTKPIGV
ncbi:MAG: HDOD domain-containing protein [Gammaproteobacteria bacterium]|nr:HDOD domain-containing protein [Gammaproteobacteria bacterium]MDH5730249.1 HDOD domain-containing protein [Gammaproteobacteria bacterium]